MRIPILYFISLVGVIIGVPGLLDDIVVWRSWLTVEGWETWRYFSVYGGGAIAILPWVLYFYLRIFQGKYQRRLPYITLSIDELLDKFKEATALEINSYIGRRMQIKAIAQEVDRAWFGIWKNCYFVQCISGDGYNLEARFHSAWKKRLLKIKKGDEILIDGKIDAFQQLKLAWKNIELINCKLMDDS